MNSLKILKLPRKNIWRSFLCLAAYTLAAYHLLFAAFRFVIPASPFNKGEYWFAVSLLATSILSLVVYILVFPRNRLPVNHLFYRMITYEQIFAAVFFLWYITVCLIRQSIDQLLYLDFLKYEIVFTAVSGLILFPLARFVGKQKAAFLIDILLHLVVLTYTIFTVLALYYAFHLEVLELPSGNQAGLTNRMQLVLGTHYNMTGAISCLMFCLSLYMVFSQRIWLKFLYLVIAFIHLLVVVLSNSRTDFLGTLFVIVFASFSYSWSLLAKKKTRPVFQRVLICGFYSVLLGFIFWNLRPAVITGFDRLTGFTLSMEASAERNTIRRQVFLPIQLSSRPFSYTGALAASARKVTADLNGRGKIWLAALKVIFHNPFNFFFGVTPAGITDALCDIGGLTERFYGSHNAFLDVAAEFGVPAFLAFVIFSVKILIRCFRVLFRAKGEDFKKIFMIPLTIVTLYVLNLTEGYLVAYFCIQSYIFFLFCGWILALDMDLRSFGKD